MLDVSSSLTDTLRWPVSEPRELRHISFGEFLGSEFSREDGAYGAVLLELPEDHTSPFRYLASSSHSLRLDGLLVMYRKRQPGCTESAIRQPSAEDRLVRYAGLLARHWGFMDEEPAAVGAPGFECAVLRKVRTPRWSLMEMETAPDDHWFRLFQEVFSTTISPLFWTWKYGEGRGRAVIANGGGQLVAHYGGTTRRVMLRGTPCLALQVCDVMVDRRERAVLTRHGAFFEVGSAWLECNFGYRRDHALAFGFPNSRAMRVGERVGLYAEVGRLAEVSWDPLPERVGIHSTTRLLPPTGDHRALFDQLWREMSRDLADRIAVIRDAEYLSYRYQTHPEFAYDFVAVVNRFTGHPRSLLVLKREADQCRLMDFVGPLQELPRAVAHARRMIGRWGLSRLVGWIMTRDAPLFARAGACVQPTDICVPTNVWSEGPEMSELRDRWWLMMGDTEFM